jgi:hypothetical protein
MKVKATFFNIPVSTLSLGTKRHENQLKNCKLQGDLETGLNGVIP